MEPSRTVAHWVPVTGPVVLALDDEQWDVLIEVLEQALSTAQQARMATLVACLRPMLEQFVGIRATRRAEGAD